MTNQPTPDAEHDPLLERLVDELVDGIAAGERGASLERDPAQIERERARLERVAAVLAVAAAAAAPPLPRNLAARIEASASPAVLRPVGTPRERPASRSNSTLGWWAAAACLLLAIAAWIRPLHAPPVASVRAARSPAIERREMLSRAGTVEIALDGTKDPDAGAVHGDVVWDPIAQKGFIRFVGLPQNDPRAHQYQIWIFDGTRDSRYPVDGGVFDCPTSKHAVIVPIHAALPVHQAKAFAITLEQPGGVVVSTRDHVVALAEAG